MRKYAGIGGAIAGIALVVLGHWIIALAVVALATGYARADGTDKWFDFMPRDGDRDASAWGGGDGGDGGGD